MIWDLAFMSLLFIGPIVLLHVAGAVMSRRYRRRETPLQRAIRYALTRQPR